MVRLSCSGTGGIYAELANGVARHNCAQVSLPAIQGSATALMRICKGTSAQVFVNATAPSTPDFRPSGSWTNVFASIIS
jgi:hypothetical protein